MIFHVVCEQIDMRSASCWQALALNDLLRHETIISMFYIIDSRLKNWEKSLKYRKKKKDIR